MSWDSLGIIEFPLSNPQVLVCQTSPLSSSGRILLTLNKIYEEHQELTQDNHIMTKYKNMRPYRIVLFDLYCWFGLIYILNACVLSVNHISLS